MKYPLVILALVLTAASLHADDITTLRGEKFTNVTISRVEPDGIVVVKKDGIVKIPFSDLSPEIRARYGYDPEKAAQYKTAVQVADNQRAAEAGAVAAANAAAATQAVAVKAQQEDLAKVKKYRIEGVVFEKTGEGLVLNYADVNEADVVPNASNHYLRIPFAKLTPLIFLRGHPDEERLANDDRVKAIGYETGVYSYHGTTYHAFTFYSK
jgi:hypothetical protein